MRFFLIPLHSALPALQKYLAARGDKPLDAAEIPVAAEVLERCIKTSEVLTLFALRVAGRPRPQ
jgi:hypothetical protein